MDAFSKDDRVDVVVCVPAPGRLSPSGAGSSCTGCEGAAVGLSQGLPRHTGGSVPRVAPAGYPVPLGLLGRKMLTDEPQELSGRVAPWLPGNSFYKEIK